MKFLEEIEKLVAILGIKKLESSDQSKFNGRNVGVLLSYVLSFISATGFVVFEAKSFREYEQAFFPWISLLFVCIGFFVNIFQAPDFFAVKEKCEHSVEVASPMYDGLTELFAERNKVINKWTNILYTISIKIVIPLVCALAYAVSYYLYFTTDLGKDSFILFDYMKFPFDRKTPVGYAIAATVESCSFLIIFHTVFCAIGILIGFFGFSMLSTECGLQKIGEFNENCGTMNPIKLKHELGILVYYHSKIKDMTNDFALVMKFTISLYYVWSILAICDTLLMCQNANTFGEIFFPIPMLLWSFIQIFFFCELGERITSQFRQINDEVWQCEWYTFPNDIQKIFHLFMTGTQTPVTVVGMGNIECTREAFEKVVYKGYSYFATLRQV